MTHYYKYLKYKTKCFKLEKYDMIGGSKIVLTTQNTNIIQIKSNKKLGKYTDKLIELTQICEPYDVFIPTINEPYDIFWLAQYKKTKDIVGYLKSSDLKQYQNDSNFKLVGGIIDKKGLQISGACNGMPNNYSNMALILLNKIEQYALKNGYQYILLHAGTDRNYLVSEGERKGLYIKAGFTKDRILKAGDGGFSDIDVYIMYKYLNVVDKNI